MRVRPAQGCHVPAGRTWLGIRLRYQGLVVARAYTATLQPAIERILTAGHESRTLARQRDAVVAAACVRAIARSGRMKLDDRIRERLAALIKKGEDVLGTKKPPPPSFIGYPRVDSERYAEWRNQTVVCLTQVFGSAHTYTASFGSSGGP